MWFSEFLNVIFSAVSGTLFFLICALAVFSAFIICLCLSVFKTGYGLKKRVWYVAVAALFCAILNARANFTGEQNLSSVLLIFALTLLLPLCFIPEKGGNEKRAVAEDEGRRRFVRFLDDKLKRAREFSDNSSHFETEEIKTVNPPPERETVNSQDIDFSHVKNVLSRLEPALLSYADRRQIHDLEMALYDAERGNYSPETRSKINEGLGNLLKIMAKHGV